MRTFYKTVYAVTAVYENDGRLQIVGAPVSTLSELADEGTLIGVISGVQSEKKVSISEVIKFLAELSISPSSIGLNDDGTEMSSVQ